jgi:ribosomal protein S4
MTNVDLNISTKLQQKINTIRKKNNIEGVFRKKNSKVRNDDRNTTKKFKVIKRHKADVLMRSVPKNIYIKKHFKNILVIKQSLRKFFGGIRTSQFRQIHNYVRHMKIRENRVDKFFELFERKLPILLLRMNFVPTIIIALQCILHGYVKVNGKVVTFTNYSVQNGDLIEFDISMFNRYQSTTIIRRIIPNYLAVSTFYPVGIFLHSPRLFEIPYPRRYRARLLKMFVDCYR